MLELEGECAWLISKDKLGFDQLAIACAGLKYQSFPDNVAHNKSNKVPLVVAWNLNEINEADGKMLHYLLEEKEQLQGFCCRTHSARICVVRKYVLLCAGQRV
jgi:hypothetical protein